MNKWIVLVNPKSGAGKSKKDWPKVESCLIKHQFDFDVWFSERHEHLISLTKEAVKKGYRHIIAVGGDGSLHQVVNGLMQQEAIKPNTIKLALISIGTGNDWVKNYDFPNDYNEIVKRIKTNNSYQQDVGLIEYGDKQRYFVNFAGIGFDAYVVKEVESYKKYGKTAYFLGLGNSLFKYKCEQVAIENDQKTLYSGELFMFIAGIGKYAGGGMKLAPNAITNDGLLDITLVKKLPKRQVVSNLPNLMTGKFLSNPNVETAQAKQLSIAAKEQPLVYAEADGEFLGTGPFKISLIKKAITVLV